MRPELRSHPEASCRTDTCTLSFYTPKYRDFLALFDYLSELGEFVLPSGGFEAPRNGRHFDNVYNHPAGLLLSSCRSASDRTVNQKRANADITSVEIQGRLWGALDSKERNTLITDVRYWDGFKRCTRWDPQITILDPELTAEEICQKVNGGELWAVGYASEQSYGMRNMQGDWVEAPTQYFGSKASDKRARIYDKAAESGWDKPAIRCEVQLRKEPADQHFRRLAKRCSEQYDNEPLLITAEEQTVKETLSQHLDLRDTEQWAGKRKPKNWAQSAPKARWWANALDHAHDPLGITYRGVATHAEAVEAMVNQYGRKYAFYLVAEGFRTTKHPLTVHNDFLPLFMARLKDEDIGELYKLTPREKHDELREFLAVTRNYGNWKAEHEVLSDGESPLVSNQGG